MVKKSPSNKVRKQQDRCASRDFVGARSCAEDTQSCVSCVAVLQDDAQFCDQCGRRLQRKTNELELRADSRDKDQSSAQDTRDPPGGSWFWGIASPTTALTKRLGKDRNLRSLGCDPSESNSFQSAREVSIAGSLQLPPIGTSARHFQSQPLGKPSQGDHIHIVNRKSRGSVKKDESASTASYFALWGLCLDEAVSSFQATEIILVAEIEADERYISFLKQQVQVTQQQQYQQCHVGSSASKPHWRSPQLTQLELKMITLEKKLFLNNRKLVSVQQRLIELRTSDDPTRFSGGGSIDGRSYSHTAVDSATADKLDDGSCPHPPTEGGEICGVTKMSLKKKTRNKSKSKRNHELEQQYDSSPNFCAVLTIQRGFRNFRRVSHWRDTIAVNITKAKSQLRDSLHASHPLTSSENACGTSSSRSLESAVVSIQSLYRRRACRAALRRLLTEVYEKVFDPDSNSYYYYSKRTKQSTWEKPILLGDHDFANAPDNVGDCGSVEKLRELRGNHFSQERHQAAETIQRLYRTRATRLFLRDLATSTLEKVFDADFGAWYYFNHRTQQSFWEKPQHAQIAAASGRVERQQSQDVGD